MITADTMSSLHRPLQWIIMSMMLEHQKKGHKGRATTRFI